MDFRTRVAKNIFEYLNNKGIKYIVLRNAEQITSKLGHDIDLCVDNSEMRLFIEALSEYCRSNQLRVFRTQKMAYFNVFVIYSEIHLFFIRIDVFNAIDYRGFPYIFFDELYRSSLFSEGVRRCSPEYQYAILILKILLNNTSTEHINQTQIRLRILEKEIEENQLKKLLIKLTGREKEEFTEKFTRLNREGKNITLRRIRKSTLSRIFSRSPVKCILGRLAWSLSHVLRLLIPLGVKILIESRNKENFEKISEILRANLEFQLFNLAIIERYDDKECDLDENRWNLMARLKYGIRTIIDKSRTRLIIVKISARSKNEETKIFKRTRLFSDIHLVLNDENSVYNGNTKHCISITVPKDELLDVPSIMKPIIGIMLTRFDEVI